MPPSHIPLCTYMASSAEMRREKRLLNDADGIKTVQQSEQVF